VARMDPIRTGWTAHVILTTQCFNLIHTFLPLTVCTIEGGGQNFVVGLKEWNAQNC
jgi:hypothetical protein